MAIKSIARRVYWATIAVSTISMLVMVCTVLFINEDLEQTMLAVELKQESDYILMTHNTNEVLVWDTNNIAVAFIPNGKPVPNNMPNIFTGLPENYSAETTIGSETYLITVKNMPEGLFYIAKNITHFEDREEMFNIAMAILTAAILVLSLVLSTISSRRIVKPLQLLAQRISNTPVGASMPRMDTDYTDRELHSIAITFNRFLDEMEFYVQREQRLLGFASHELRTPIAVMSGALDVLEHRKQIQPKDQATLQRIRTSCNEMKNNVEALLKLSRRDSGNEVFEQINLQNIVIQIIDDLRVSHNASNRVIVESVEEPVVYSDQAMMHMMLRNLIQNAIQHTDNAIKVRIFDSGIEISDQGSGLTSNQKKTITGNNLSTNSVSSFNGLGLHIVTLIAERLGLVLKVAQSDQSGTIIAISQQQKT